VLGQGGLAKHLPNLARGFAGCHRPLVDGVEEFGDGVNKLVPKALEFRFAHGDGRFPVMVHME